MGSLQRTQVALPALTMGAMAARVVGVLRPSRRGWLRRVACVCASSARSWPAPGLPDAEHLADAWPDEERASVDGLLVGGRAGGEVLAVRAVELTFLGGDDDRLDVVVRADVICAALLGREEPRRRPVLRRVESEPLERRPGVLVADASQPVDLHVDHVEPDVERRHPSVPVVDQVPGLVSADRAHRFIQAGGRFGALRRCSRSACCCSSSARFCGPVGRSRRTGVPAASMK